MNPVSPQDQEILSQFADIVLPAPVGWWPLSLQLWVLILVCSGLLIVAAFWLVHIQKRNAYKKITLRQLSIIESQIDSLPVNTSYQHIHELLKSCLLASGALNKTIASLHGKNWFQYLFDCLPVEKQQRLKQHKSSFSQWSIDSYSASASDVDQLLEYLNFARQFVSFHQPLKVSKHA